MERPRARRRHCRGAAEGIVRSVLVEGVTVVQIDQSVLDTSLILLDLLLLRAIVSCNGNKRLVGSQGSTETYPSRIFGPQAPTLGCLARGRVVGGPWGWCPLWQRPFSTYKSLNFYLRKAFMTSGAGPCHTYVCPNSYPSMRTSEIAPACASAYVGRSRGVNGSSSTSTFN